MISITMMSVRNGHVKATVKVKDAATQVDIDDDSDCTRVERDKRIINIASSRLGVIADDK